jgi:hypothetical protein
MSQHLNLFKIDEFGLFYKRIGYRGLGATSILWLNI